MRSKKQMLLNMIGVSLLTVVFCGCFSNRISLTGQGLVSVIEKENEDNIRILWADVYKQDGKIWAYGAIKSTNSNAVNAHMDIEILDNEGFLLYETFTEEITIKRTCDCKRKKWEKIRVQLPDELPENSQVVMMVHSGDHIQSDAM